jgi:hypothetical protein
MAQEEQRWQGVRAEVSAATINQGIDRGEGKICPVLQSSCPLKLTISPQASILYGT